MTLPEPRCFRYGKVYYSMTQKNTDLPDGSPRTAPIFGSQVPSQMRRKRERPLVLPMQSVKSKVRSQFTHYPPCQLKFLYSGPVQLADLNFTGYLVDDQAFS